MAEIIFDLNHPLKHPNDDDTPLECLRGKTLKDIMFIIGAQNSRVAAFIKHTGCSWNEAHRRARKSAVGNGQLVPLGPFNIRNPLQHPRDDDYPLLYLRGFPIGVIKRIVGIHSSTIATLIQEHGCSLNQARKMRPKPQPKQPPPRRARPVVQDDLSSDDDEPQAQNDTPTKIDLAQRCLQGIFPESVIRTQVVSFGVGNQPTQYFCSFSLQTF